MRRADRLIKIVHYLRRMPRAVTAKRIAEDFSICQRTVYRDIHDLMNAGVPIFGEAGVGYVIDKKYHMPPVMFDQDELEAISLGIGMVRNWTDQKFAAKAVSAYEKIQAVVPDSLLNELHQLTIFPAPSASKMPWRVDFSVIRECIRASQNIKLTYVDRRDQYTERIIRPLALIFFGPVWLLVSWFEERKDFRSFRLDRMEKLEVLEERFKDEADKNLNAYTNCMYD